MNVLVMGAGAMGSYLGASLARDHDVTLVGRQAHVDAVNAHGLRITGGTERVVRLRATTSVHDAPRPELVLIAVKSYATRAAIEACASILRPATLVLTLQNGLGNIETLLEVVSPTKLLAGATTMGVTLAVPGHIVYGGPGYLRIGCPEATSAIAIPVVEACRTSGLDAELVEDVAAEIWAKVVVNVAINPLAAITGLRNGSLLELAPLRSLMDRSAEEAIAVAEANGIALPEDVAVRPRRVAELTAKNKSSMLQDVERGRRTEIDALSGEIVRRGEERGVAAPVNATLWGLVKGIEASTRLQ
ncbi:MAG: ketopantoate reductase family protein [Thermoplasmatota archaeon]